MSTPLEDINSLKYVTVCVDFPKIAVPKANDYCSKSKMNYKVIIGLCGVVHGYLWHSAGIMFQLVYKFITEKQFKYKMCYTYKGCLNNTICDECKFTDKNSHHNNLCLTLLQVKHAKVMKI